MKKIGILGGTFNPVHYSHLLMAEKACEVYGLDQVYLMPTYLPPHKETKEVIDASHRLNMLNLAVEDNDCLAVETFELKQQKKLYTYETMQALSQQHPDVKYYFIIGGDMMTSLSSWYRIDELKKIVTFIGVERVGYTNQEEVLSLVLPQNELSSSYIRQEIKAGRSVRYLVPEAVRKYIEKEGLYRE